MHQVDEELTVARPPHVADVIGMLAAQTLDEAERLRCLGVAENVDLDEDAVAEHALTTYRTVGPHWSSMAVDIRERRRTEVDALCGEVSRLGRLHGIATPVNDTITNLMRAIEQSWAAPT